MNFLTLLLIAFALSIDNFAIAMAAGASHAARHRLSAAVRLPLVFGICAFVMPLVGWLIGSQAVGVFRGYGSVVAFAILMFVGWRTMRHAWKPEANSLLELSSLRTVIILGILTSNDALAVGFGLALVRVNIVEAAAVIGSVTGVVSLVGILVGHPVGRSLGALGHVAAGLVLMLVGVHALVAS